MHTELPWHELGKLRSGLATADAHQVAKIVALVDALEARGAADDVIAPLRPRLAQLRVRRPLRFPRLLFMPLDPLIVPAAKWRPGDPTIPRNALLPLAETVHAAMAGEADVIEDMIRQHSAGNNDIAHSAGSLLWPAAAAILAATPAPPAGWADSGLPADTYVPLARVVAVMLEQTPALHALFAEIDVGVSLRVEPLVPLLAAAAGHSADALAMIVALVLARLPEARSMLAAAASGLGQRGEAVVQEATERAIGVLLDRLESPNGVETLVVASNLAEAGPEVRRIACLLKSMQPVSGASLRNRLRTVSQRLDASCRLRFATALEAEFAEPLRTLTASAGPDAVARLEVAARGLQGLQQEARRIGSPDIYDMLLQQTATLARSMGSDEALDLIGRVRLVEILAGPDEAAAMLEAWMPGVSAA